MIEIYTDGACSQIGHTGHGPGGWAAIIKYSHLNPIEITGGAAMTTNNRMEMQAVIEGLRYLGDTRQDVILYSDSAYVVNCMTQRWYAKWRTNGWLNSSKKPVENQDLWQAILDFVEKHNVTFAKVKGHANNKLNNQCDRLAVAEAAKHR